MIVENDILVTGQVHTTPFTDALFSTQATARNVTVKYHCACVYITASMSLRRHTTLSSLGSVACECPMSGRAIQAVCKNISYAFLTAFMRLQAIQHSETVTGPCEEEIGQRKEEISSLPGHLQRV